MDVENLQVIGSLTNGVLAVLLVMWVIRVLIPRLERTHEAEVQRLVERSEQEVERVISMAQLERDEHRATIERILKSHERVTRDLGERISRVETFCARRHGAEVDDT